MTLKEILTHEPRLLNVIDYANDPKRKSEYFEDIYSDCKVDFKIQTLVGNFCDNPHINNSECYELFIKALVNIIESNCKDDE